MKTNKKAIIAGLVVLHERVRVIQAVGIAMILFGVYRVNMES